MSDREEPHVEVGHAEVVETLAQPDVPVVEPDHEEAGGHEPLAALGLHDVELERGDGLCYAVGAARAADDARALPGQCGRDGRASCSSHSSPNGSTRP